MQQMQQHMQQGFTLVELLVTMVIMALAVASVAFAIPSGNLQDAEREETRLLWVIGQAHATAQRHRTTLVLARLPTSNGYRILNAPASAAQEPWAQLHECGCSLARLDISNAAEPLRIEPDALLPHFQWRIDVKDTTRIFEYPSRAS